MQQQPCAVNSKLITEVYYSYEQPQPCIGRNVFFFLLLHGNAEQSCRCKNMWSAAAASAMEDSEPNRTARPSQKKKSTGSLSACMAMAMLLPWRTTFFRFTSCQPRGDPAQGINMGA